MSDTLNQLTSVGNVGMLTVIPTEQEIQQTVQDTAAAVIPPAIASVIYRVDPLNRHLYRSRNGGPETDLGLVGGTRFWGPFSTVDSMPKASDGVMGGDLAFNTNNQAFYYRQSGSWNNMGSLRGTDGIGVASAAVSGGNLTLTLTNGTTLGPFAVKGADATVPTPTATASPLASGSAPTVSVSSGFAFVFGIPSGQAGTNGTTPSLAVGTVTTGAAGSSASVSRRSGSTDAAPIFDFTIPRGNDGASGVVAATAPLSYNATTKTVSIDLSAYATVASLSNYATATALNTAIAGVTLTFNAPLSKSGTTVSIPAANGTTDGYMPATMVARLAAAEATIAALQAKQIKGGTGRVTVNVPISLIAGSQDVTIPLNYTMPDLNYLPLAQITSTTGIAVSSFTVAVKSKTANSIVVTLTYPAISALSTVTIVAFGLESA